MSSTRQDILEMGYTIQEFPIPFEQRKHTAYLANKIIDLADSDIEIYEALTFDIYPEHTGWDITGYDIRGPRVGVEDESVWFHSGWQTADVFAKSYTGKTPELVSEFFDLQREYLQANIDTWIKLVGNLALNNEVAATLIDYIADEDILLRNQHLRGVRYRNMSKRNTDKPSFTPHGDLSMFSTQSYETHQGHLHIAPYPLIKVSDEATEERIAHAESLIADEMQPVFYDRNTEAVVTLGFGAANYRVNSAKPLQHLSGAYHIGLKPEQEVVTSDDVETLFGEDNRFTLVGFCHPSIRAIKNGDYKASTPQACRPTKFKNY